MPSAAACPFPVGFGDAGSSPRGFWAAWRVEGPEIRGGGGGVEGEKGGTGLKKSFLGGLASFLQFLPAAF